MTEEEARDWCVRRYSAGQVAQLEHFARLVLDENERQDLISPATASLIWSRHIADSAQLLMHRSGDGRSWLDIGSGPGFPGIVIAILSDAPVTLVEPRTRRVEFLNHVAQVIRLDNVIVHRARAEAITGQYDVITARAVASIANLVTMSQHLRTPTTRLILPRGRNGAREVAELPAAMRGMFHVEQSITDPESAIVIADGVIT